MVALVLINPSLSDHQMTAMLLSLHAIHNVVRVLQPTSPNNVSWRRGRRKWIYSDCCRGSVKNSRKRQDTMSRPLKRCRKADRIPRRFLIAVMFNQSMMMNKETTLPYTLAIHIYSPQDRTHVHPLLYLHPVDPARVHRQWICLSDTCIRPI